ncbi:MAG: MASE1 domain-containing protein, partial [Limnobacter sp.]|nr:MASE1 domain-containing protein [Limnobacter sp.]
MQHLFDTLGRKGKETSLASLAGLVLLTAFLYAFSGQLSFSAAVSNQIVTPVFFAAEGFALAAVLLFGPKMALGVFVGQLALALFNGLGLAPASLISLINSIEALIGYFIFRMFRLDVRIATPRDLIGLLGIIFLILQPFSATLGNLVLWYFDILLSWEDYLLSWESWWLGNCMGQAHLAPALLFMASQPVERVKQLG